MDKIQKNIINIKQQIKKNVEKYDKNQKTVSFIAVSKKQPISAIISAISAGQKDFGESYLQESIQKIKWFQKYMKSTKVVWHFIGHIQYNKSKIIAKHFDWCHSLARSEIVQQLHRHRPIELNPLNVLIQVNVSYKQNKSGINPDKLFELAAITKKYSKIKLCGLMAIPNQENGFENQFKKFKQIYMLYTKLKYKYPEINILSLGMSGDMQAAIAAGANLLRIGTAIFGNR